MKPKNLVKRPYKSGKNQPRKDGRSTVNIKLRMKRSVDVKRFYDEIGFDDQRKQDKLKKALELKGVAQSGQ